MSLVDFAKDFACGCVSGWTQVVVMQPFEIVKVRLVNQSSKNPEYRGIIDCFRKIFQDEGFSAFYKGSLSPLLGIGAQVALQFGSNGMIKEFLHTLQGNEEDISNVPTLEVVFASGFLTGVPSAFVTTPVDRTRILMQIQRGNDAKNLYHSSLDAGMELYKKYGLKELYAGFKPTFLREILALSAYFGTYELGMRTLASNGRSSSQAPILGAFLAGGAAGCASWLFTYPIDYVKTLIQSQLPTEHRFTSALDCAAKQYRLEGSRSFFKGLGVSIVRSFPVNGTGFLSFEFMMRVTGRKGQTE